jgi:hypothetical protein
VQECVTPVYSAKISAARSQSRLRRWHAHSPHLVPTVHTPLARLARDPIPDPRCEPLNNKTSSHTSILPLFRQFFAEFSLLSNINCYCLCVAFPRRTKFNYTLEVLYIPACLPYPSPIFTCQFQVYWAPFRSISSCIRYDEYLKLYLCSKHLVI